jgi:hypothetical protein
LAPSSSMFLSAAFLRARLSLRPLRFTILMIGPDQNPYRKGRKTIRQIFMNSARSGLGFRHANALSFRRSFLALSAMPWSLRAFAATSVPVGLALIPYPTR